MGRKHIKLKKMSINELIKSGANVQLVVNALDLKEAFLQWCEENIKEENSKEEVYLTPNEAAERLCVTKTTLWRWNKSGYLHSFKRGNKAYYRMSDIKKLMEG